MAQPKPVAPPDATHFKAGGRDYYLYLDLLELQAIQREWGYTRASGDRQYLEKTIEFNYRMEHPVPDDALLVLKTALGRWAAATGAEITDESVADILAGLGPQDQNPAAKGFKRSVYLYERLILDCYGRKVVREGESAEDADPKGDGEASTPSIS